MNNKILALSVAMVALLATQSVLALPFSAFDPRSFGMGGTGVAAGTSANAVFFNPALLAAANKEEDFSLEFPIFGLRATDPDDFIDAVDDFDTNNFMASLDAAIAGYIPTNAATETALITAATQARDALVSISNKAVELETDVAFVVGIPSKKFGISIYANAWAVGGAVGDTSTDVAVLDAAIAEANASAALTLASTTDLNSTIDARFAVITEVGVAIARDFNGLALGITPKYVEVTTSDYSLSASQFDTADIDNDVNEVSDSDVNFDVGVAKDYGNGWKVGLVVKNLLSQDYTTALGNTLTIDPMARVGFVHQNSWNTVAIDVDLTENDPGGFDTKTQFAAIGMELDLFDTAQLRVGLRHNMSDNPYGHETDTLSAGLGFSPFGIHLDVSAAGNADEVGGAIQLGFRF